MIDVNICFVLLVAASSLLIILENSPLALKPQAIGAEVDCYPRFSSLKFIMGSKNLFLA
jgi:hypothetical protein